MITHSLVHEDVWYPFSESIAEWDFDFHDLLLQDTVRMSAYKKAIFSAVQPGDIVVDLGTGTGILAVWALQAGAERVHAIDFNETLMQQARKRIAQNGYSHRARFYQDISYNVQLPEKCNLLISEIIGNIADNEDFLNIIKDARQRFLLPQGGLLPTRVVSYLTPVEALSAHAQIARKTCQTVNPSYDLTRLLEQNYIRSHFDIYYDSVIPDSALLANPAQIKQFCFRDEEQSEYCSEMEYQVHRSGLLTGFKGHFVADLTDSVVLDISSGDIAANRVSCSWKHAFFPLETPIQVEIGDRILVNFSRHYPEQKHHFRQIYRWAGKVYKDGQLCKTFTHGMDFIPFSN